MILSTLGSSLIGNLLSRKGMYRSGKGMYRSGHELYGIKALIVPKLHPLTNFEIEEYYKNKPRFNGVYSKDNLPKIKQGVYVINLDEHDDIGTHWTALHVKNNEVIYFDSFGVEYIPEKTKIFIRNKNIKTNVFRIQVNDSIMC